MFVPTYVSNGVGAILMSTKHILRIKDGEND